LIQPNAGQDYISISHIGMPYELPHELPYLTLKITFIICTNNVQMYTVKKTFSRFVITTYFLLSNQLYNNLFSGDNLLF